MTARTDRGELARPVRRPDGAVVLEGRIARTGPLSYGTTVERRDERGLAEVARTAIGRPVTLSHPAGLVRDGVKAHVVGRIESTRIEADHVIATMRIDDPTAIAGAEELSIGYSAEVDGDGFQRQIVVDHVALVPVGRCGPSCRVQVDSATCKCGGTCVPCRGDDYQRRLAARRAEIEARIDAVVAGRDTSTARARFIEQERNQWMHPEESTNE